MSSITNTQNYTNLTKQHVSAKTLTTLEVLSSLVATVASIASLSYLVIDSVITSIPLSNTKILGGLAMFGVTLLSLRRLKNIKPKLEQQALRTLTEASKTNHQSMLIFQSSSDHNGAFQVGIPKKFNLFQRLAERYSIKILEITSKAQLQSEMGKNSTQYDRILFRAHGGPEGMRLAASTFLTQNSQRAFAWLNDHIKDNGIIELVSCSTGKGTENIARTISRACPKATVYAPGDQLHIMGINYDESLMPSFNDYSPFGKGKDITRVYKNGDLIAPSTSF